jgi:hypothetical protein
MPLVTKVVSDVIAEFERSGKATTVEELVDEFEELLKKHGLKYRKLERGGELAFAIYDKKHGKDIIIRVGAWK